MEWKIGDKYFFKLSDGGTYNGEIIRTEFFMDNIFIIINDKFGNEVGFKESKIDKYELTTKVNKVNNES